MTDREVLYTVIETASKESKFRENYLGRINSEAGVVHEHYYAVIFAHDFAKAFWGEELVSSSGMLFGDLIMSHGVNLPAWKIHLQQMVLEKNPIDYLRKFVEDE